MPSLVWLCCTFGLFLRLQNKCSTLFLLQQTTWWREIYFPLLWWSGQEVEMTTWCFDDICLKYLEYYFKIFEIYFPFLWWSGQEVEMGSWCFADIWLKYLEYYFEIFEIFEKYIFHFFDEVVKKSKWALDVLMLWPPTESAVRYQSRKKTDCIRGKKIIKLQKERKPQLWNQPAWASTPVSESGKKIEWKQEKNDYFKIIKWKKKTPLRKL